MAVRGIIKGYNVRGIIKYAMEFRIYSISNEEEAIKV